MKKFMMFAAVAMMALAANAQNADALKQVKSADSYSAANEIMKAQAQSMTPAERAQAYNKMIDLAVKEGQKADEAAVKAQLAKDDATQKAEANKAAEAYYNVIATAALCDDADNQPNEKGQVKPKFRSKNQERVITARNSLINAGLNAYNSKDYASAQKYFGAFVDSRNSALFSGYDFSKETNFGQIAYYAGLASYFNNDFKQAMSYVGTALAQKDTTITNDAITLICGAIEGQAKNGAIDTTTYIAEVQKLYDQHPENQMVFGKLIGLYQDKGDNAKANKILSDRLQSNPNDVMALAYVAQNAQNESKWDDAIAAYDKVLAAKPDFIQCKLNEAVCYLNRGANLYDSKADAHGNVPADVKAQVVADFDKSKALLEDVKKQDPDELQVKWSYQMQRVDYAKEQIK